MIGIKIKLNILNIDTNDKPVLTLRMHILLISKLYLQIFNFLYF